MSVWFCGSSATVINVLHSGPKPLWCSIFFEKMAPRDGFEPPAKRLTVACSTAELPGNNH